jgi:cellobiose epimerase
MIRSLLTSETIAGLKELQQKQALAITEVLQWWMDYMQTTDGSGFYGSVHDNNQPNLEAAKGVVMHARILWAFSAAAGTQSEPRYLQMAEKAFRILQQQFTDAIYGGVYWSLQPNGIVADDRKQIYGLAFCIYGYAEYYRITHNSLALLEAKALFNYIEKYSYDVEKGGYIEAFTREWENAADLRLSEKDANERKTMNTHLHVVEAYANLYTVWPDKQLKQRVQYLLQLFVDKWINAETGHLHLFMDDDWQLRSSLVSYGHDIEAAWLLLKCAEQIQDPLLQDVFKNLAPIITNAALRGWDESKGGLWYEYDESEQLLIKEKHSWPQAEALIGLVNAYAITDNSVYLKKLFLTQQFIENEIQDKNNGEWYWGVYEDGTLMQKEKAGFWKCPYHNTRAFIELSARISNLLNA